MYRFIFCALRNFSFVLTSYYSQIFINVTNCLKKFIKPKFSKYIKVSERQIRQKTCLFALIHHIKPCRILVRFGIVKSEEKMHFYVVKSKTLAICLVVIIVAILLAISIDGVSAAQVYFGYANRKVPVYYVQTEEKRVAISFDAAWGADKTQGIMDTLKEYGANGTFFLVGFWTDKYADMVKKIDENGFEIGTHSNTHPDMTKLSAEAIKNELEASIKLITDITGKEVKLFRPPFGAYNNTLLNVADEMGLISIQWDVDTLDWKGLSGEESCNRVLRNVRPGSIILCHNNSDHILDALPLVLDRLQKQGYTVGSVGELVMKENFEIDRNGMQKALA